MDKTFKNILFTKELNCQPCDTVSKKQNIISLDEREGGIDFKAPLL